MQVSCREVGEEHGGDKSLCRNFGPESRCLQHMSGRTGPGLHIPCSLSWPCPRWYESEGSSPKASRYIAAKRFRLVKRYRRMTIQQMSALRLEKRQAALLEAHLAHQRHNAHSIRVLASSGQGALADVQHLTDLGQRQRVCFTSSWAI